MPMLKIRQEQMKAFQPVADRAFERRLAEHLRKEETETIVRIPKGAYAVRELREATLLEMVHNGVERARKHKLTWDSSIGAFVIIMFVAAPNFDEHPLINRVLTDERLDPNARVDQLWERVSDQNWDAAIEHYDANAWQLAPEEATDEQEAYR